MPWDFTITDGPYGNVTEGPAWDGSGLLFTYIEGNQILRFDPETGGSAVVWSDTNNANGLMLDASGTLFACEGGARGVVRYESDGAGRRLRWSKAEHPERPGDRSRGSRLVHRSFLRGRGRTVEP